MVINLPAGPYQIEVPRAPIGSKIARNCRWLEMRIVARTVVKLRASGTAIGGLPCDTIEGEGRGAHREAEINTLPLAAQSL